MIDVAPFAQFINMVFLTKTLFLVLLFAFFVFTLIVVNQVRVMNKVISEEFSSSFLTAISLLFVALVLSLFIAVLVIL